MNYSLIYQTEVLPILENFQATPPWWVYAIIGGLFLTGLCLVLLAGPRFKMGGAVFMLLCGFIAFMVYNSRKAIEHKKAEFRTVTIIDKEIKKSVTRKTTGIMKPEYSYWLTVDIVDRGYFDSTGKLSAIELKKLTETSTLTSKSIYEKLEVGERVTGIVLPTAKDAFHAVIRQDGEVLK